MPTDREVRDRGREGGLKGGPARAAVLSARRRSEIARIAAQERWALVRMRKAMLEKRAAGAAAVTPSEAGREGS